MTPSDLEGIYVPGAIGQGHQWRMKDDKLNVKDVTPSLAVLTVECEMCGLRLVLDPGKPYKDVQNCMETIIV
jgi:hypothetical protein